MQLVGNKKNKFVPHLTELVTIPTHSQQLQDHASEELMFQYVPWLLLCCLEEVKPLNMLKEIET